MMMVKFSEILKELRIEKNLSRQELANLMYVSPRTICYWELGQRECNLEQLVSLANIFSVSTDYLLGLENSIGTALFSSVNITKIEETEFNSKLYTLNDDETKTKLSLNDKRENNYTVVDMSLDNFTAQTFNYSDANNKLYGSYTISATTDSTGIYGILNTKDDLTSTVFANQTNLENKNSLTDNIFAMYNENNEKFISLSQLYKSKLSANAYYKLSVWVKTQNIEDGKGLTITLKEISETKQNPLTITFENVNTNNFENAENNNYKEYSAFIKIGSTAISDMQLLVDFGTKEQGLAGYAFIGNVDLIESTKEEFNNAKKANNLQDTENTKFIDLKTKSNKDFTSNLSGNKLAHSNTSP